MNIERALRNNRVLKSLTGLNIIAFNKLSVTFEAELSKFNLENIDTKKRQRALGGGRKSKVETAKEKLFFLLFYFKVYPTFDVAGFLFDANRSQPFHWVKKLQQVLERSLKRALVLPKRKISSVEEFLRLFPEAKDIFIDGVERKTLRPKKPKAATRKYSGKKKTHTRKNIVITNEKRKILVVTKSKNGKMHDKKILDKANIMQYIPKDFTLWVDKGFKGINKLTNASVMMPKFNSKKNPLTKSEKENNAVISGIRMLVEHAIGGVKRFAIIANPFRNKNGSDDKVTELCAGLWNYHLEFSK